MKKYEIKKVYYSNIVFLFIIFQKKGLSYSEGANLYV